MNLKCGFHYKHYSAPCFVVKLDRIYKVHTLLPWRSLLWKSNSASRTHVNVIPFTPLREVQPSVRRLSRNLQCVWTSYTEFHTNRNINVKSTSIRKAWLPRFRFPQNSPSVLSNRTKFDPNWTKMSRNSWVLTGVTPRYSTPIFTKIGQ
jgi:hypothetical protein